MNRAGKYYAVASGKEKGIFRSWDDAKGLVTGYSNAKFKSFKTEQEAKAYMNSNSTSSSSSTTSSSNSYSYSSSTLSSSSSSSTSHSRYSNSYPTSSYSKTYTKPTSTYSSYKQSDSSDSSSSTSYNSPTSSYTYTSSPSSYSTSSSYEPSKRKLDTDSSSSYSSSYSSSSYSNEPKKQKFESSTNVQKGLSYWPSSSTATSSPVKNIKEIPSSKTSSIAPSKTLHAKHNDLSTLHLSNIDHLQRNSGNTLKFVQNSNAHHEDKFTTINSNNTSSKAQSSDKSVSRYNTSNSHSKNTKSPIVCFVDGASKKNPGVAGSGITIQVPVNSKKSSYTSSSNKKGDDSLFVNVSLSHGTATNNYSELRASEYAFHAIESIPKRLQDIENDPSFLKNRDVELYLDSEWTMGMITGQMKPSVADLVPYIKKAQDSLENYKQKYDANVSCTWVRGHSNTLGNEVADLLANYACEYGKENKLETRLAEPEVVLDQAVVISSANDASNGTDNITSKK